jgi:hypothetical protein
MQGSPDEPRQQSGYASETEQQLQRAEQEDAGRGLEWVWVHAETGYQYVGLETLLSDGLTYADAVSPSAGGLMVGAGGGIRLLFLALGARARLGMFDQWNVGTIDAEGRIHIPLGELEPYFTIAAGYAFLTSADASDWGGDVSIRGWNARTGVGLDYYITPVFSVGGNLSGEALFLNRSGLDVSAAGSPSLDAASQATARADGSGIGAAVTTSFVLGLHL